jgi:hypothetical protein
MKDLMVRVGQRTANPARAGPPAGVPAPSRCPSPGGRGRSRRPVQAARGSSQRWSPSGRQAGEARAP